MLEKEIPRYTRFPCVMPAWDNAARRRNGATILHGSTPQLYQKWLTRVLRKAEHSKGSGGIVFVNAWNEWAEGNHLEPCQRWGRAYLEATREAVAAAVGQVCSDGIHAVPNDRIHAVSTKPPPSARFDSVIRAARADTVEILQHARDELAGARAELEASLSELKRLERLRLADQELETAISPESPFILVGEQGSPTLVTQDPHVPVLLKSDEQYAGPPANDETAIREVEQLRQAGARFLVVTWPAFWWLDCYAGLQQHLRSRFRCLVENERLVVFDLRAASPAPAQGLETLRPQNGAIHCGGAPGGGSSL
jgi:hypothetical protein